MQKDNVHTRNIGAKNTCKKKKKKKRRRKRLKLQHNTSLLQNSIRRILEKYQTLYKYSISKLKMQLDSG